MTLASSGFLKMCTTLMGLLLATMSMAFETQQEFTGSDGVRYEVHYIAIPTTLLEPEIAATYQLVRSKSTGLLNVSVNRVEPDGKRRAIPAFVRGDVVNDVQQRRALEFQRITEGDAVYAIAPFWYSAGQIYTFDLEIQADPEQGPFRLRFTQALYPD